MKVMGWIFTISVSAFLLALMTLGMLIRLGGI
jgi:hypothetical protein